MQIVNGIGVIDNVIKDEYCTQLIKYFYSNAESWEEGKTLSGLNTEKQNSIKLWLRDDVYRPSIREMFHDAFILYLINLSKGIDWDYNTLFTRGIRYTGFAIRRYIKGEGHYNAIHQERDSTKVSNRMFVIMVYLNSVNDGGETIFPYFDMSVSPVVGRVVIWPAGMPYLHQGVMPIDNHKFIITTWVEQVKT